MPREYIVETEVKPFSDAIVIDEIGGLPTFLIDNLISRGFTAKYLGVENPDFFSHLSEKKNFEYLNSSEIKNAKEVDYVFYFPSKNNLDEANVKKILSYFNRRLVFCISKEDITDNPNFLNLFQSTGTNVNLIVYGECFGPRIRYGFLGELFGKIAREKLENSSFDDIIISPVFSEKLSNEIIRLAFFPAIKNKIIYLHSEELTLLEFLKTVGNISVLGNYEIKEGNKPSFEKFMVKDKLKQVYIENNLEEEVEVTLNWFKKNIHPSDYNSGSVLIGKPDEAKNNFDLSSDIEVKNDLTEVINDFSAQPVSNSVLEIEKTKTEASHDKEETKDKETKDEKLDFLYSQPSKGTIYYKENDGKSHKSKRFFGFILIFVLILSSLFTAPLVTALGFTYFGFKNYINIEKKDLGLKEKEKIFSGSSRNFGFAEKILVIFGPFYNLIGLDPQVEKINQMLIFSRNYCGAGKYFTLASIDSAKVLQSFLKSDQSVNDELLNSYRSSLSYSFQQASIAQSLSERAKEGYLFLKKETLFNSIKDSLVLLRENLTKQQEVLKIVPEIMAVGKRKVYLVLLQNNMELRPTGGFISSVGVLTVENGRLVNFETTGIYDIDKNLKGQIEPPAKIKELLGEKTWFLRDANWFPDFSDSAEKILWFIDKEMQISPDGVIAVNLNTLQKILESIGPVEVTEFQEKVDKDNLFEKAIKYSESTNISSSKNKKGFPEALLQSIFEKIKLSDEEKISKIQNAVSGSLENKDTLVYFSDSSLRATMTEVNWSGELRSFQPKVDQVDVIPDYLYINEANVGINQVNFFVKRKINHQVMIGDEYKISEKVLITYDNQSTTDNWPFGKYKAYIRVYLPKKVNINSVLITDPDNNDLWIPMENKLLEVTEDHGKTVIGFYTEIPAKSQKKIEIDYELSDKFVLDKKIVSYLLMLQKQPGIDLLDYSLVVTVPQNMVPVRVIPKAEIKGLNLIVSEKISKDKIFQFDLAH